jgi:predicted nucleic-acid-binding protein
MIAVDTNVILRFLVQDDPKQATVANHLLENVLTPDEPGFVTIVAVLELDWVLRSQYLFSQDVVVGTLSQLMQSPNLVFEHAVAVKAALAFKHGDLADNILHQTGITAGCTKTLTFDKKFARLSGVEVLK